MPLLLVGDPPLLFYLLVRESPLCEYVYDLFRFCASSLEWMSRDEEGFDLIIGSMEVGVTFDCPPLLYYYSPQSSFLNPNLIYFSLQVFLQICDADCD